MIPVMYEVITATTTTTPAWLSSVDFSNLTTVAESLAGIVAPVIVTIMGIGLGLSLLKKFGRKISG